MVSNNRTVTRIIQGVFVLCLLMSCISLPVTAVSASPEWGGDVQTESQNQRINSNSSDLTSPKDSEREKSTITRDDSSVTVSHTVVLNDVAEETRVQFSASDPAVKRVDAGRFEKINTSDTRYSWRAETDSEQVSLTFSYVLANDVVTVANDTESSDTQELFIKDYRQFQLYSDHTTENFSRHTSLEDVGVMTTRMAYIGESNVYAVNKGGTQYSLVVPQTAADSMYASPEKLTAQLASSGDLLSVGNYHNDVTIIASPTTGDENENAGIFWPGPAEGWVSAAASERTFPSAWYHEIAHAAQPYEHDPNAKWFVEGTAEYYGVVLPHEVSTYDADLQRALSPTKQSQPTLSDQSTWRTTRVPYDDGSIVAAQLDRKIRSETNDSKTLTDLLEVVAANHSQTNPVENDDIINHTRSVAGPETAQWLTEVTTEPLTTSRRSEMEQQLDLTELASEEEPTVQKPNQSDSQPPVDQGPVPQASSDSGIEGILAQLIERLRKVVTQDPAPEV